MEYVLLDLSTKLLYFFPPFHNTMIHIIKVGVYVFLNLKLKRFVLKKISMKNGLYKFTYEEPYPDLTHIKIYSSATEFSYSILVYGNTDI